MASCFGTNNGQIFNRFVFNNDGTVLGEFNDNYKELDSYGSIPPLENPVNLPSECCTALGYTYDVTKGKCFYKDPCETQGVKVLFGLDQNNATRFLVEPDESCTLNIKLDFLMNYDCNKLIECANNKLEAIESEIGSVKSEINDFNILLSGYTNHLGFLEEAEIQDEELINEANSTIDLINRTIDTLNTTLVNLTDEFSLYSDKPITDLLSNLNAKIVLDKVVFTTGTTTPPYTYEKVAEFPLLTIGDFEQYVIGLGNNNSGISITGDDCTEFNNAMKLEFGENCELITEELFNSNWINFNTNIADPTIISAITNELIHISVVVDDVKCDLCFLLDKIKVNKICTKTDSSETYITQCPGFKLNKILDNKKSWTPTETLETREFDLVTRETEYNLNDSKLVINTKEIDLNVDPSGAIECNLFEYVKNHIECILSSTTTNYAEILDTELSGVTTKDNFIDAVVSELIDVKTRKTLRGYPTLVKLYEIYQGLVETGCPDSSKLNYGDLDSFINLLGDYWVDLIEQFVPATSIWGSTHVYRSTAFHQDKYKYTPNTIDWGCSMVSTIDGDIQIDTLSGFTSKTSSTLGSRFYDETFEFSPMPSIMTNFGSFNVSLADAAGNPISHVQSDTATQPLWGESGSLVPTGRLDASGFRPVESAIIAPGINTFKFNVTIPTTKKYYIGFGSFAGNSVTVNGKEIHNDLAGVALNSYYSWSVVPMRLDAGVNEIILAVNALSTTVVTIGLEIYDATITDLLNAPDLPTLESYLVFTTASLADGSVPVYYYSTTVTPSTSGDTYLSSVGAEVTVSTLDTSDGCTITDPNPQTFSNLCLKKVDYGAEYLGSFKIVDI